MALPFEPSGLDVLFLLFGAFLVLALLMPAISVRRFRKRRRRLLAELEAELGSKVLTLVHGKAPLSFFGFPFYSMIDIDDAESVLRGIRRAGDKPVDLILHTPGGQYHASLQIARALKNHKARTRVFVPHYAMSGGTLIALGANEIVMDPDAIMGPVDPQVGDFLRGWHSTASWVKIARQKGNEADDVTLALADVSGKLQEGTRKAVWELVEDKVKDSDTFFARMVEGGIAHGYPMSPAEMKELGLPVSTAFPRRVHELLSLYKGPRKWTVEQA